MRGLFRAAILIAAAWWAQPMLTASPALAFGDQCFGELKVNGSVQSSMSRARGAAIAAWERAVAQRHGSRFADWYYSADRTFECSWNTAGTRIRCLAIATPCGRKR